MRILLDESMPRPFARDLIGHDVKPEKEKAAEAAFLHCCGVA